MKRLLFLVFASALIGGGYYLGFVHSSVPESEREACEAAFTAQFSDDPELAARFFDQCRNPATLLAGQANAGQLSAEEAAEMIGKANRNQLIKIILAFAMIGGGIGALGGVIRPNRKRP